MQRSFSAYDEGIKDEDANVLLAQIEDYFTDRGGTYKIVDEE
jgi:hypothetical protein